MLLFLTAAVLALHAVGVARIVRQRGVLLIVLKTALAILITVGRRKH